MDTVGIYEAKNKLSQLLGRVEAGEVIALARHGRQVALLTPIRGKKPDTAALIRRLRQVRSGTRLAGLKIKTLRDQGRP